MNPELNFLNVMCDGDIISAEKRSKPFSLCKKAGGGIHSFQRIQKVPDVFLKKIYHTI